MGRSRYKLTDARSHALRGNEQVGIPTLERGNERKLTDARSHALSGNEQVGIPTLERGNEKADRCSFPRGAWECIRPQEKQWAEVATNLLM